MLKRTYKISISILAALIVIMVVFNLMFSSILRWQVENFSNGKIHLRSERASANIFNGSIDFKGVLIDFDSVSVDAASKIYLQNLKFSSLKLSHISIFQLLFKRNFKIDKIDIADPELNFMRDTVILGRDFFSKVITPEVVKSKSREATFSFDIGEIVINQGAMHFRGRTGEELDLGKINIRIRDVRLSDLSQMETAKKDLSAHFKLNVNLYDVRKRFRDAYTFSVDSFSYYSGMKYLLVSGIAFTPDSLDDFTEKPEIKFRTDFLRISGFELNDFIMNENLEFKKFEISNADLWESKDWFFLNNDDARDTVKKKNVPKFQWLNSFHTDTFQVNNINVLSLTKKLDTIYEVKDGNLLVVDIRVDSNFLENASYLDLTKSTFARSGAIKFHWVKPVLDFSCDTFSFTGSDGTEFMKNIRFSQHTWSKEKNKQKLLIDAHLDSLGVKGLNIRRLLTSDSVHLSLFLKKPKVEMFVRDSLPQKNRNKKKAKPPSTVFVDEFRIQDGDFRFASDISGMDGRVENMNLLFDTLQINTDRIGKPGFVDFDGVVLNCAGIQFQNGKKPVFARIDNLFLDEKDFILTKTRFSQGKASSPGFVSLKMKGFSVSDFNLMELMNNKEFVCGEIVLRSPEYVGTGKESKDKNKEKPALTKKRFGEEIAALLKGKLNKLQIGNIQIMDGFVDFRGAKDSLHLNTFLALEMQNIRFDPNGPLGDTLFYFPDYFKFDLKDPGFSTSRLSFRTDAITYNNLDGELAIVNLFGETPEGCTAKSKFKINVPLISLRKPFWEPEKEQPLRFASLFVKYPSVFLEVDKEEKPEPPKPGEKFALPFQVGDSVKIIAGSFKMQINKKEDTLDYSIGNFDFGWDGKAEKTLGDERRNDLLAGIDFNLENIILNSGKSNISLDNLYFDKENNIIELDGIKQMAWKPAANGSEKKLKNRISMPKLHVEYPNLYGSPGEPLGLSVSNIYADETKLEFYTVGGKSKKAPRFKISDSTAMKFLQVFEYVKIDSIYFPNIHVRVNTDTMIRKPIDFKHISFHVNGLLMDSSLLDPEKSSYADDIFIHLHDREIYSADSMYKFRTSYLTYYLSKDQIVIDSLQVIPQFEKDEFFQRAHFQTDRMQVNTKNVIVDGIDLESLIKTGEYHFDKITVNELHLLDYRDKRYARKEGIYRPLPKEMLEKISPVIQIDTIEVNDSYILYGEYVDKSDFPGEVYFEDFNARVYNVTNMFKKRDTSFVMTTQLQSKLMGSADLDLTITVPLMDEADYFWFQGKVDNLDLTKFNSMTENLFGISIRRGHGSVEIPLITANNTNSLGEMTFKYKKFKLAMYNRKKARMNRGIASPLIDFMMNGVLIKSNNPKFLGKKRVGEVYFERDQNKSVFNYIWKSAMSGALSTMGFNKKEQRQAAKEKKKEMKDQGKKR